MVCRVLLVGIVGGLVLASPARAGDGPDIVDMLEELPGGLPDKPPRFAFSTDHAYGSGIDTGLQPNFGGSGIAVKQLVVARAADGSTAWFAADVQGIIRPGDCAPEPCRTGRAGPPLHATGLVEKVGTAYQWVAWHIVEPVSAKQQAAAIAEGAQPDVLPRSIAGAEDVVALFEKSIADPKALAASISARKDVVLYGSAQRERVVGGAKVKARLLAWKLGFAVRDGVQAGLNATKTVAWIAANVDATSLKRPNAAASPYRVLAIYEKTGGAWQVVQLHFSVDTFTYKKK